jgi:hypothetical protein
MVTPVVIPTAIVSTKPTPAKAAIAIEMLRTPRLLELTLSADPFMGMFLGRVPILGYFVA